MVYAIGDDKKGGKRGKHGKGEHTSSFWAWKEEDEGGGHKLGIVHTERRKKISLSYPWPCVKNKEERPSGKAERQMQTAYNMCRRKDSN